MASPNDTWIRTDRGRMEGGEMKYAPCPDCKQEQVCGKCKSDIAFAKWALENDAGPYYLLIFSPKKKGKNWLGEDGML